MDPWNGFVVDGTCALGVKLLRVHPIRVKRESALVHHRLVDQDHTWSIRNFSTLESFRWEKFETAGCRWSIYLYRIRVHRLWDTDVVLFLSLDSMTGHKKSLTVSYQLHVKGLVDGNEICDAYTNVFVPGQCHGHKVCMDPDIRFKSGWSFDEDTCTVRVRLFLLGYAEAKNINARAFC